MSNDEHNVFFSTCMAQSRYGQSACWSDSMTSTHIVWSYLPLPPEKAQRQSWNASVRDATVVTYRQGTGHWHAHCYDTLTWGAKVFVYTFFHHSSHKNTPSPITTELPHLPKTSISGCNTFFIGSVWQVTLQMYLWKPQPASLVRSHGLLDRHPHKSLHSHHHPRCLYHNRIDKVDLQNLPFKPSMYVSQSHWQGWFAELHLQTTLLK